eukprot:1719-Hanusia_phi.AAC.1
MSTGDVYACPGGYFCPEGAWLARRAETVCTKGHACPENTSSPVPCAAGYYQDEVGQSSCKTCLQ